MAQWIEDIPQWVNLEPEWVEGLATPQWVECGWAEFNPVWIDGPVCPAPPIELPSGGPGGSADRHEKQRYDRNHRTTIRHYVYPKGNAHIVFARQRAEDELIASFLADFTARVA